MTTQGAGRGDITVAITSPSGSRIKAHIQPTHGGYLVQFTPTELGDYLLNIAFGGMPINTSPHRLKCRQAPNSANLVRAYGPGLSMGHVGRPAEFLIDTRSAGQGGLGVTVEGPSEAAIRCCDNGDGTCSVAYVATEVGEYLINITFNDQPIYGSPFMAAMICECDVSQIKTSGNGIQRNGTETRNVRKKKNMQTKQTNHSGSFLEQISSNPLTHNHPQTPNVSTVALPILHGDCRRYSFICPFSFHSSLLSMEMAEQSRNLPYRSTTAFLSSFFFSFLLL